LVLEFKVLSSNGNQVKAEWIAYYTFGATMRKVRNQIIAEFEVVDGKIVKHIDRFDFHTWAKQALGPMGLLLSWTPYLQNKVRKTAMKGLYDFMAK
jgi:limonene-1,2-epoxide hydrolase